MRSASPRARLATWSLPLVVTTLVLTTLAVAASTGCKPTTGVEMYVSGFQPQNVRFEVEDQGALEGPALDALAHRRDIDGALLLPAGSCGGPCRVAIVSVFVHNVDEPSQAPPVVRLKSPAGKAPRQPIAFRGAEISKSRYGRIRWVVEMWPEEKDLTATLSSSVFLVSDPTAVPPVPPAPSVPPVVPPTDPTTAPPAPLPPG